MPEHRTGTREEWQAARDELAKLEAEHAELSRRVTEQRRQLPWVPVEKEYQFDTEDGKKTLAELFDGRSQLLAYNIMFGPDYELGACPGCSNLGDELDAKRLVEQRIAVRAGDRRSLVRERERNLPLAALLSPEPPGSITAGAREPTDAGRRPDVDLPGVVREE